MEKERRAFLEKFVMLSSATFVLGGCGSSEEEEEEAVAVYGPSPVENNDSHDTPPGGDEAVAVYGPPPVMYETLIYVQEDDGSRQILDEGIDLPLDLLVLIQFPQEVQSETVNLISFVDQDNTAVAFDSNWTSESELEIRPLEGELAYGVHYTIRLGDSINDNAGNPIDMSEYYLSATFTTLNEV